MDGEQEVQSSPSTPPEAVVSQPVNEVTTESQSQPEEQSQETTSTESEQTKVTYEGKNFVDFTPEQLKRVNTLTKKASSAEQRVTQAMEVLRQQSELINELRNGQTQIVNHLQTTNYADAEAQLKVQRKTAYDRGDLDAVDAANDRLADIKIARKTAEMQAKTQPKQQPAQQPTFAQDPVEMAVQKGEMSRSDADAFRAWETETDQNGNLVRPWTLQHDGRNAAAGAEGRAVFSNPVYQNKPFAERLKEIDRRMGVSNQKVQQGVMPAGNLTGNSKTSNIRLSTNQENIAVKTKFAGPNKSNADHIEAYRKEVMAFRGARK